MKIYKIIAALLSLLLFLCPALHAATTADPAAETDEPAADDKIIPKDYVIPQDESVTIRSKYALVYSEYDDRFLYRKNDDQTVWPASTTKIMVGVMIFEKFADRLDTQITITKKLLEDKEGLSVYLEEGEILTMRQLLTILLMHGANDVSTILAHYYMQDVETEKNDLEAFADLMTARAAELGCTDTTFKNVTGLHKDGERTTMYDIIKIAVHAASIPGFTEMTSTDRLVIEKNGPTIHRVILSRNHLVSSYQTPMYKTPGVTGMNYGSTEEMGECLLTSAEYDGKRYFSIIMGGRDDAETGKQTEFVDTIKLLEYVRTGFEYKDVLKKGVIVTQANVRFSTNTDAVTLAPEKTVSMYLPVGTDVQTEITFRSIVPETVLDAPVAQGTVAGEVIVEYNGAEVCRVPLVTTTSVAQSRILYMLDRTENFVKRPVVIASLISFFVLAILYVLIKAFILGQKKKRRKIR
ncbi:MAG: D-alanyl-D-alanine carboxypeptidase [Clostridia bacterium]|nr:D-alanyl-D-alanine carboxypeptidase [Clostridia bacterium]